MSFFANPFMDWKTLISVSEDSPIIACLNLVFQGCTSLKYGSDLPPKTATVCSQVMFKGWANGVVEDGVCNYDGSYNH